MASGFRRQSREPSLRPTSGFETTRTSEQASPNWPPRKEPNQTNSIMVTRRRRRDNGPRHTRNRRGRDRSPSPRGTRSSNPVPSSRQSVSLRILPPSRERRGFSAILAAIRGGSVGRDAQAPQHRADEGWCSLSDDIPVPQCCRMRFARLAAPAANESGLAIAVGVRIGSSKAEQGPLILPGQWQT